MLRNSRIISCLAVAVQLCAAISNSTFTWIDGSNVARYVVVVGAQHGVYSSANQPGARNTHCLTLNTDQQKLYLFGGYSTAGRVNDLWAYDMDSQLWAWLSGQPTATNVAPTYGTQMVEDVSNSPGSLFSMSCIISPVDGHLYVHGGRTNFYKPNNNFVNGVVSDLWRFNTTTNNWAWLSGDGQVLASSTSPDINILWPAHRESSSMGAHYVRPVLLLFGGNGLCGSRNQGYLLDLWEFNITATKWTRIKGNSNCNGVGNFNAGFGVAADTNVPPARWQHQVTVATSGDLYLFGGAATLATSTAPVLLSDLWKYTYSGARQWIWIGGSKSPNQEAIYGAVGTFNASFTPGARANFQMLQAGNLPILVFTSGITNTSSSKNDAWVFDFSKQLWSFIGGTANYRVAGQYGSIGVSSNSTMPGCRAYHSMTCQVNSAVCYIYGGTGYDGAGTNSVLSDLWELEVVGYVGQSILSVTPSNQQTSSILTVTATTLLWPNVIGGTTTTLLSAITPRQSDSSTSILTINTPLTFSVGTILTIPTKTDAGTTRAITLTGQAIFTETPGTDSNNTSLNSTVLAATSILSGDNMALSSSGFDQYLTTPVSMIIIAGSAVILLALLYVEYRRRSKKHKKLNQSSSRTLLTSTDGETTSTAHYTTTATGKTSSRSATKKGLTTYTGETATQYLKEFSLPGYLQFQAETDFRWDTQIGRGGSGAVYLGTAFDPKLTVSTHERIVVKIVAAKSTKRINPSVLKAFHQEVAVMHYLTGHPNVVRILGWSTEPLAIIMRYYPGGTLSAFIKDRKLVSMADRMRCLLHVSHGLSFMHSKLVAHRDIKTDNVLVELNDRGQPTFVLADLGIAAIFAPELELVRAFRSVTLNALTVIYAAPEMIKRYRSDGENLDMLGTFLSDIYSFSVLEFKVLCGVEPWSKK